MRPFFRAGACCLPVVVAIFAACSEDPATTAATFDLALTIEGAGQVVSVPSGVDCTGPKDCGTSRYAVDAAVKLTPTAAAGFVLSRSM